METQSRRRWPKNIQLKLHVTRELPFKQKKEFQKISKDESVSYKTLVDDVCFNLIPAILNVTKCNEYNYKYISHYSTINNSLVLSIASVINKHLVLSLLSQDIFTEVVKFFSSSRLKMLTSKY